MKKIFLVLFLLAGNLVHSQGNTLAVIGNQEAVPNQLTLTELQSVFMGKTPKWATGGKVIIALMKLNTEVGKNTCERVYQLSPDEVKKFWLTQSFRGGADAPVFFNTADELREFLSKTRGAIGILDSPAATPRTKIVLIDGKKTF